MRGRLCGLLIAFALVQSTLNGCFAKEFSDMDNTHWAYDKIQSLTIDKVLVGYPDGSFQPDQPATRAEFSTMVIKALRQERSEPFELFYFSDLAEDHWAYKMIQRACAFDLIKGFPDGTYKPEDNISKAEAVSIIISAINTGDITEDQAKDALKVYQDADKIPSWLILSAAKAEKLGMIANNPITYNQFEPDKKITRAEVAANLYNMREQARINPNYKLSPKKAEGIVLDNVTVDGTVATIPKGTLIPIVLLSSMSSQLDERGQVFAVVIEKNLVTKENYLLIPQGSNIAGLISDIKPARYFIRNGKMQLDTNSIKTNKGQKAEFPGNINTKTQEKGFKRIVRYIIRGKKVVMVEGKQAYVKLNKPLEIDLTSTRILK